jgi:probable rRNA maturation factor
MVEINNLTSNKIDRKALINIAEKVLKEEKKEGDLSIALVCGARMRSINKKYRKKDKITDVLSFGFLKDNKLKGELGEIVICPEVVKKNAKNLDLDYNKELARVLIHGVLHILGYDHEKAKKEAEEMIKKEEKYNNLS